MSASSSSSSISDCIFQDVPEVSAQIKFCDNGESHLAFDGSKLIRQNSEEILAAYANISDGDSNDIDEPHRLLEDLTELFLNELSNGLEI